MTECTQTEIRTKAPGRREFVARFDGGEITSDAGALLLGAVEERRGILKRLAGCFADHRSANRVEHTVEQLVSQRVLAIALGYEDVNDHELLRLDPLLAALAGKADPKQKPTGGSGDDPPASNSRTPSWLRKTDTAGSAWIRTQWMSC